MKRRLFKDRSSQWSDAGVRISPPRLGHRIDPRRHRPTRLLRHLRPRSYHELACRLEQNHTIRVVDRNNSVIETLVQSLHSLNDSEHLCVYTFTNSNPVIKPNLRGPLRARHFRGHSTRRGFRFRRRLPRGVN